MLNVECWMLNVESECWNVECWRLKHNISTFQHRETVNISTLSTFEVFSIGEQHSTLKKKQKCWQCCQHLYKITQHLMLKTSTCWNVENVERLKGWNVEMLRLKCWFLYYKPQHFNISTLEFLNISTFNISTFQRWRFQIKFTVVWARPGPLKSGKSFRKTRLF